LFLVATTYALSTLGLTPVQLWSVVGVGFGLCLGFSIWGWVQWDRRMPILASGVPCLLVTLVVMPALQSHLATKTFTLGIVGSFAVLALALLSRWEFKRQHDQTVNRSKPGLRLEASVMKWVMARQSTRVFLLSFSMVSMASQFATLAMGFASLQASTTFSGALLNACVLQVILESNFKIGLMASLRTVWLPFGLHRKSLVFQLFFIRFTQLLLVFSLFAFILAALSLVIDFPPIEAIDLQVLPFLLLAIWVLGLSLALWSAAAKRSVFWSLVIALVLSPLVLFAQYHLGIGQWQTSVVNSQALRDAMLMLICAMAVSLAILIHANRLPATKDLSLFLKPRKN
jgi:hypothetical protein